MSRSAWYEEQQKNIAEEQLGLSSAEVEQLLREKKDDTGKPMYQHIFNPDTAPKQEHRWVDRGLKMSCEGANHPYHQSWKKR